MELEHHRIINPGYLTATLCKLRAFLVAQRVKNLPAMQETWVRFQGQDDPLEEGMATHCSILAWRIPMDRGAWWATVHGVAESQTGLSNSKHSTWHGGTCPFGVVQPPPLYLVPEHSHHPRRRPRPISTHSSCSPSSLFS